MLIKTCNHCHGLVHYSRDQVHVHKVIVLAEMIVLCSWARYFTLTVPLSPPRGLNEYRWTNIPPRSHFMLWELEIRSGLMGHLAGVQTLSVEITFLDNCTKIPACSLANFHCQ